jgi:hypothetical protein
VTVLYAAVWSCDTTGASGSSGLLADTTPGRSPSRPTTPVICPAVSGSVTLPPPGACITTCAVAPADASPKRSRIRSRAVVDSCPGISKVLTVLPESVKAPTPSAISATSQTATTAARFRTDARPRRCSNVAMCGSLSQFSGSQISPVRP